MFIIYYTWSHLVACDGTILPGIGNNTLKLPALKSKFAFNGRLSWISFNGIPVPEIPYEILKSICCAEYVV